MPSSSALWTDPYWPKKSREFWQDVDLDTWAATPDRGKTPASGYLLIVGTLAQVNGRIVLRDTEGVQYELQDRGSTAMDLAYDMHRIQHDTPAHVTVLWDGSSYRLSSLTSGVPLVYLWCKLCTI